VGGVAPTGSGCLVSGRLSTTPIGILFVRVILASGILSLGSATWLFVKTVRAEAEPFDIGLATIRGIVALVVVLSASLLLRIKMNIVRRSASDLAAALRAAPVEHERPA